MTTRIPQLFIPLAAVALGLALTGCGRNNGPAQQGSSSSQLNPNSALPNTPPKLLRGVRPSFPKELWDKPGVVQVLAVVGPDGKVTNVGILQSPHPELNPLAVDAVKKWEFEPAKANGKPVPASVSIRVTFDKNVKPDEAPSK